MELVILGSSASCPGPNDACSGYLVRAGRTQVLLDCGSGVLGRLVAETHVHELAAIVISHFHPDHYLDLVPMRYGLRYGAAADASKPLLLVPPGGSGFLSRVGEGLRGRRDFFSESFQIEEYEPAAALALDDLTLAFQRTSHDEPCWATAVTDADGTRLVYSGDTKVCPDLEDFARGADLLLCEATYPAVAGHLGNANHLTGVEAGRTGRRAGVRRLALTHFFPGFDRVEIGREAEESFGHEVALAAPGLRLTPRPLVARTPAPARPAAPAPIEEGRANA